MGCEGGFSTFTSHNADFNAPIPHEPKLILVTYTLLRYDKNMSVTDLSPVARGM